MAKGYTQMTGRMQAVLLHAGAGLLQGSAGMHSAMLAEGADGHHVGRLAELRRGPRLAIEPQWYRRLSIVGGPQRLVEPATKWAPRRRTCNFDDTSCAPASSRSALRWARSISMRRSR